MHKPIEISLPEWAEIMQVPEVRDGWSLAQDESPEFFSSMVYGVKFKFTSGGPGYSGDLYLLQDDTLEPVLVLIRKNGVLERHSYGVEYK